MKIMKKNFVEESSNKLQKLSQEMLLSVRGGHVQTTKDVIDREP